MTYGVESEFNLKKIQELLGIPQDDTQLVEPSQMIAAGIPVSAVVRVKQVTGLSEQQLAQIVGVSRRTISRRLQQANTSASFRLTSAESDRLYRLARIVSRAGEVFGDQGSARQWLNEPKAALKGQTPLEAIKTEPGVQQVDVLLGRIEHGIFA